MVLSSQIFPLFPVFSIIYALSLPYPWMESVQHYIKEGILYEPVIPNIQHWPITEFFKRKKTVIKEVTEESIDHLHLAAHREGESIGDLIARTMYLERIRMTEDPWKVDPNDEQKFWQDIKKELVHNEQLEGDLETFSQRNEAMLRKIVTRYAEEISSNFKPSSYHFAKRFLPFFFSTLLNASAGKTLKAVINHRVQLQEKIHLLGEIESIRKLSNKGTIVLAPTHISNVDSLLVGWSLHAIGMPAFIYGAGLNLYNSKPLAYFMKRLGAYKIDRRKKNPIYRETLNAFSTIAVQQGVHGIFFPGGTRSRSGVIEKKLKLGLIGTAIEAQRRNCMYPPTERSGKIFIVPMVMSYHFVLEAATLINQYLTREGKENYYILNDEFASYRKFLLFVWQTFSAKSEIAISFGKPMDLFGNFVDNEGNSFDNHGRIVEVADYFKTRGKISEDSQRDAEYTRMLGEKLVERFHVENYVFSSHLVAYVAFEILKKRNPDLDLFGILRLPEEERIIQMTHYQESVERVLQRLRTMADHQQVHLAQHLSSDVPSIIEHGIQNLGIYHAKRPLNLVNERSVSAENMNLLFYYHNRLEGYDLSSFI